MPVLSPLSEPELDVSTTRVRAAVDRLFTLGAIAALTDEPRPILVGEVEWMDDTNLFVFAAHGDAPADAHRLTFDDAVINSRGSVTLLRDEHVVGVLHAIDDADVDDPEDYRIAWQLWQEVAPLRRELIDRCFEALQASDA